MRAVIVYESMFGNTRRIAEAIAEGFGPGDVVRVLPVADLDPDQEDAVDGADLLVVGGPTHAHSMSRPSTRHAAADAAARPGSGLTLQPGATGHGLREWLDGLGGIHTRAAAFDTRLDAPQMFTGRAAHRIERMLHHHGAFPIADAESFVVTKDNELCAGELDRAREWGRTLAHILRHELARAVV